MSCCGFGTILPGVNRLRGVLWTTPVTLDWITRKSRRVRPREILRTFCMSSQVLASRASTITLRTPICSISAMTCARAPADGQHGDDRGYAEDHAQHGEQRAELVHHQVFEAQAQVHKVLCPVS